MIKVVNADLRTNQLGTIFPTTFEELRAGFHNYAETSWERLFTICLSQLAFLQCNQSLAAHFKLWG